MSQQLGLCPELEPGYHY